MQHYFKIPLASILLAYVGIAIAAPPLILDGIGPSMATTALQVRFPHLVCTKSEMKIGTQRSRTEQCRANGTFAGRNAEYIVTFAEGRMDGVGIVLRSNSDARVVARKVLTELTARHGEPTERHPEVLELKNPEFAELASWLQRPNALIELRVCQPVAAGASLTCPDQRVIINASYSQ